MNVAVLITMLGVTLLISAKLCFREKRVSGAISRERAIVSSAIPKSPTPVLEATKQSA